MAGSFVLPGQEHITMTGDDARKLLGCGSGDAALLYIYILSSGGHFDREDAAKTILRSLEQVDAAMDVLYRLGLVRSPDAPRAPVKPEPPEELPAYSVEDIKRELEQGSEFKALVGEVQQALGSHLSSEGLVTLFGIYDYLRLPAEVILTLVTHCREEFERRYGPARRPTMRYIEKAAYTWEREGVFSLEAAEAYLKRLNTLREGEHELAQVLGLTGRPLVTSERRYLDAWLDMGFTAEAAALAYDRTVLKTGRLTWKYMDSILKSWHAKGLHTPAEIESGDGPKYARPDTHQKPSSTENASATAEELENMRATLRRIKEGN